jgi:hypothetical protein
MKVDEFQLPASGYETLARIIQGYLRAGAAGHSTPLSAVADATAMRVPDISANNGFLSSVGVVVKEGGSYRLTSEGAQLATVLGYQGELADAQVQAAWNGLVSKNDFLMRVLSAVQIRREMDSEAFAQHIALTAGVPYSQRSLTGARAIVEILLTAGMLVKRDGAVRIAREEEISRPVEQLTKPQGPKQEMPGAVVQVAGTLLGVRLNINVDVSPERSEEELEAVATKIRALLAHLTPPEVDSSEE